MPGMFAVDARRTFATALLMGCAPRTKYGTADQDVTAQGLPRWDCQVAVTFLAEPGQRVQSEVISVTIAATADPGAPIAPGTPVELDDLRLGITTPEARENGRVRGGKPYYTASGLRPSLQASRKGDAAA